MAYLHASNEGKRTYKHLPNAELNRVLYKYLNDEVKLNRKKTTTAVTAVTQKVQEIVKYIHSKDERFQSEIQCSGSYYQGLKVKAADEFDFNIHLSGFEGVTTWGGGDRERYYRFNRDYKPDEDIRVYTVYVPVLMQLTLSMPVYQPYHTYGMPPVQGSSHSAMPITSPKYNPNYSSDVVSPFRMPSAIQQQAPPMNYRQPLQIKGPVKPPVPPVDIENLNTLPDNMELLPSRVPLGKAPEGYHFFDYVPAAWKDTKDLVYEKDIIPFYVQRRFKKLLQQALRELDGYRGEVRMARKAHGPALTIKIPTEDPTMPEISVDFAVTIPTKLPVPNSSNWPRPNKTWPSREKIAAINRAGIVFVARKPYYWLASYSACEKELIDKIDKTGEECRKDCHRVMKRVREKFWCKTTKPAISSYHLKNILFWECEDYPHQTDWKQDKIWERFESMTQRLLKAMDGMQLPQYFNSKINLLQGKDLEIIRLEKENIKKFMSDPPTYLAQID